MLNSCPKKKKKVKQLEGNKTNINKSLEIDMEYLKI